MAQDSQISPSQLDTKRVDESIHPDDRTALIEAINRAIRDDPPTLEEDQLLQSIRENQRKLLEAEG